jgi:hypothetical protein
MICRWAETVISGYMSQPQQNLTGSSTTLREVNYNSSVSSYIQNGAAFQAELCRTYKRMSCPRLSS